jgi:hypothetical protein
MVTNEPWKGSCLTLPSQTPKHQYGGMPLYEK